MIQKMVYDNLVWVNENTEEMRKKECLCLNCNRMRPLQPDHCKYAARFYEICVEANCAFMMTRCKHWKVKERG